MSKNISMKRAWILTLAALAALAMGGNAQVPAFDKSAAGLPDPVAVSPEASGSVPVVSTPTASVPAQREWLVLVFINGVNDLGVLGFANKDINEMEVVGSSDKMAVVVEYGILGQDGSAGRNLQFQRGSKTIYITRDADTAAITSPVIYSSNDADMGSEANLVRFVKRGLRRYPARKVALVLWNHGDGRLGISFDDVSKNYMEVDRLGAALEMIKLTLGRKIDVIATDACYMQMASVAYEFMDKARVIVGSEEIVPGNGYPYTPILSALSANPSMGAETLGQVMVDAYGASYPQDATLSALRSDALPGFVNILDGWVSAIMSDPSALASAANSGLVYSVSRFGSKGSKDLMDYIDRVDAALPAGHAAKHAAAALRAYMPNLVLRNVAKPPSQRSYTAASGLSIYIPALRYNSANYERLLFAEDSLWDDFLLEMMKERLK
jgi:hypothetical protein